MFPAILYVDLMELFLFAVNVGYVLGDWTCMIFHAIMAYYITTSKEIEKLARVPVGL